MKRNIETQHAPQAIGVYSQAIVTTNTVYLSGQIPLIPETMELVSDDFTQQAHQVFKNMAAVCHEAGGELNDIVKLSIFLMDLNHFASLNAVMQHYFSKPYPARSTFQVSALPKQAQIEIEAIMALPGAS